MVSATTSRPSDNTIYFAYSASLRIFGNKIDFQEITQHLGVAPTVSHRRGERQGPKFPAYEQDAWIYDAPVAHSEPLSTHIDALWNTLKGNKSYLLQLKRDFTLDVFLGYRSNCDHCGVEVPYESLKMFSELQVPFGLSIIVV